MVDQKLRRRRDLARQRWPFGQHKMAVCLVAWTAVPESLRRFRWWSRPMISCRDEVSALTIAIAAQYLSARRERPLVHIRTRIRAGDPVPLNHQQIVESRSSSG